MNASIVTVKCLVWISVNPLLPELYLQNDELDQLINQNHEFQDKTIKIMNFKIKQSKL